MDGKSLDGERL